MENKKLGLLLIALCIALAVLVFTFNQALDSQVSTGCACVNGDSGGFCPHAEHSHWQTYVGIGLISIMAALGIYLIFFEKSQKEIVSALGKQKQMKIQEEKFSILLKGLNDDEKKVIKAVKEQDGITQQTLRLRADLHKSKLSIVLDGLEKKSLIKRVAKGKTKQVFLKVKL
jgi:DNA-binding MarR family transcriptional regulator